jgi:hypothetical protein
MTFRFPKSALPPELTLRQRMDRDMAASEGFNKLRGLLKRAMEEEQSEYEAADQARTAEARRANQAAREAEVNSDNSDD